MAELQRTMAKKQQAVETLKRKSIALKKGMEPRQAYKFKREGSVEGNRSDQMRATNGSQMAQ